MSDISLIGDVAKIVTPPTAVVRLEYRHQRAPVDGWGQCWEHSECGHTCVKARRRLQVAGESGISLIARSLSDCQRFGFDGLLPHVRDRNVDSLVDWVDQWYDPTTVTPSLAFASLHADVEGNYDWHARAVAGFWSALASWVAGRASKAGIECYPSDVLSVCHSANKRVPRGGGVYFLQTQYPTGPIKIGRAKHYASRIHSLQTSSPWPLVVLATIDGDGSEEKNIHDRFAHLRMRGEWFMPGPDLVEFVKSLGGGAT